jgi:hypothetical protein
MQGSGGEQRRVPRRVAVASAGSPETRYAARDNLSSTGTSVGCVRVRRLRTSLATRREQRMQEGTVKWLSTDKG